MACGNNYCLQAMLAERNKEKRVWLDKHVFRYARWLQQNAANTMHLNTFANAIAAFSRKRHKCIRIFANFEYSAYVSRISDTFSTYVLRMRRFWRNCCRALCVPQKCCARGYNHNVIWIASCSSGRIWMADTRRAREIVPVYRNVCKAHSSQKDTLCVLFGFH